jgi:hypothetical protein
MPFDRNTQIRTLAPIKKEIFYSHPSLKKFQGARHGNTLGIIKYVLDQPYYLVSHQGQILLALYLECELETVVQYNLRGFHADICVVDELFSNSEILIDPNKKETKSTLFSYLLEEDDS